MDIKELEDYRLSDAVKFHTHLNPQIWGPDEHLLPAVRQKLLAIAADFREFLGLDLEVEDITISGSNAAYTYTDHSDIDLHLVTDMPRTDIGDVYRELFDSKKYQYTDQHNFTIGGYDVELYVQDANKTHASQGIYSVINNKWISVPKRRKPDINDISVKSKYEDLGRRIEAAVKSGDRAQLDLLGRKVGEFRQAGLDTTGEFGPENLAFKILRTNGTLDLLRAARLAARDQELSIAEAGKKKKKKPFRYGFGGYYSPGYNYYGQTDSAADGGGDGGGGENVQESTESQQDIIERFTRSCADLLGIQTVPKIKLRRDPQWTKINGTFGRYTADPEHRIELATHGRHIVDILRTLAHEITHARQNEVKALPDNAGETGSKYEDSANAMAGRIMRHWAESEPHMFQGVVLEEDSFNDNFNQIDSIITKKYPKEIMNLLLGMFPTAKEAIVTQYNDEDGMPFAEWRRAIYDIGNYVLSGPVVVNGSKLPIDPETEADRLAKYQQYIKDKDSDKPARYFRNNDADPRTIDFTKLPPITLAQTDAGMAVTDGNHRAFLAKMANKPLRAYVWKRQTNNHPNVAKIKALFSNQQVVAEASGYIPVNKKQAGDPRYSMAITQDIKPGEPQRQAAKMGWRTDPAGAPPVAQTNGLVEALTRRLQAVKQGSQHMPTRWQDIWQLNGQVSTDQWCELIENYHLEKTILKESVEESIVNKINQLIDNFSSDTETGQRYVPVLVIGINNHISFYDVEGHSPPTRPAEFLTLVKIRNQQLTFEDQDGKQFTYPDRRLSDISYAAVLALDSIEKYDRLRTWLKLQDGTQLPAARQPRITEQEQELAEVAMSPSALRAFAASPAAAGMKAGFEAELVFTGVGANEQEGELEPDYSNDPRAYSMDDIRDFFNSGEFSEGLTRRQTEELEQDFHEWSDQALYDEFDAPVAVRDWILENDWDEEDLIRSALDDEYSEDRVKQIIAAMERRVEGTGTAADADLVEEYVAAEQEVKGQLKKRVELAVEEQNSDYESALDEFRENWDKDESDWLSDRGWRSMNDIAYNFDFPWPHYTTTGGSGEGGFNEDAAQRLADDLADELDVTTTVSTGYHSARRDASTWIFEPDGSLEANDDADMPVEIVSPPMSLAKTLEILPRFFEWAKSNGAYANSSTGFHMSVSMPDHAGASLDYTKLALFLGDEYVLQQFGRAANTYAASAVSKIQSRMTGPTVDGNLRADVVLSAMRKQLNQLATAAVATPSGFGKYTSINPKTNYIEFRSAGGSDYFKDMDRIQNTLMRYARAMDIAFDPDADKPEYAKKLYKLLTDTKTQQTTDPQGGTTRTQVKGTDSDAISIFSRFVAGDLPKSELKGFIKKIQYGREVARQKTSGQVSADYDPNGNYVIRKKEGGEAVGPILHRFSATGASAAISKGKEIITRLGLGQSEFGLYHVDNVPQEILNAPVGRTVPATRTPQTDQLNAPVTDDPEGNFVLRSRQGNRGVGPVLFRFRASTNAEAIEAARQWTTARGLERMSNYFLDQVTSLSPEELAARPTNLPSQTDAENRLAIGDQTADANWEIIDNSNQTSVFRFVANTSAGASYRFTQWLDAVGLPADTQDYGIRRLPPRSNSIPEVPLDVAQNFPQLAGEFSGEWRVVDGLNREVHRFGGVGNSQSDANRVAREWAQRTGFDGNLEVYPVMR